MKKILLLFIGSAIIVGSTILFILEPKLAIIVACLYSIYSGISILAHEIKNV